MEKQRGKTALITGCGRKRVGYVVAKRLLQLGYKIAVHYHSSESSADANVEEFRQLGPAARYCLAFRPGNCLWDNFHGPRVQPTVAGQVPCGHLRRQLGIRHDALRSKESISRIGRSLSKKRLRRGESGEDSPHSAISTDRKFVRQFA